MYLLYIYLLQNSKYNSIIIWITPMLTEWFFDQNMKQQARDLARILKHLS